MRERGKPDDQCGGFARSKPAELKTIPATDVVLGNHTTNEFIGKSLCEALAREREGVSVDNFTGVGVEIARDTGAIIGVQGGALDPAFRRFREILSFGQKCCQVGGLEVELVNPGRGGITSSFRKLLNCCIIRSSLGAGATGTVFLDRPGGPVQEMISET